MKRNRLPIAALAASLAIAMLSAPAEAAEAQASDRVVSGLGIAEVDGHGALVEAERSTMRRSRP